jgi:hypothetical protein
VNPERSNEVLGYVLRVTQGPLRDFYCTKQQGGRYLAVFRRQQEITGAIAFLHEGGLPPMAPPATMQAVGVSSRAELIAIVQACRLPVDGLAIALDFRTNGSVARWGVSHWDTIEWRC